MSAASFDSKAYFNGRARERQTFAEQHVKQPFTLTLIAEDMASRRYFRIMPESGESLVLMEAIPDYTGAFTPGHKLSDFIRIDGFLHDNGIHVPEIYAQDDYEGYVLLEDFGDTRASDALDAGIAKPPLYKNAVDILVRFKECGGREDAPELPRYYDAHVHKARRRLVDWYLPTTRQSVNGDDLLPSYLAAWDAVERALPSCPMGFVHGDFHVQNLMVLPDDKGLGVLDFQGAMWGPLPYDLANLLEDMRTDVPDDVYREMLTLYGGGEEFQSWFRVLATQFHCRMLGQVLRLAIVGGKPSYLRFLPRLQNYVRRALKDPVLTPLAQWFAEEKVDLTASGTIFDPDAARAFIRPDAF